MIIIKKIRTASKMSPDMVQRYNLLAGLEEEARVPHVWCRPLPPPLSPPLPPPHPLSRTHRSLA